MKRLLVIGVAIAVLLVGALPATAGPAESDKICLVSDTGGFDNPFSAPALDGAEAAARKFQLNLSVYEPETSEALGDVIGSLAASGACDLIIGVGFEFAFEAEPFVPLYPEQMFSIIDGYVDGPNVADVFFRVDQGSFLAGYLAAAISETGVVGVYGGMPFFTVTMFMDGYALGVDYYNALNGASVEVLGWDVDTQVGEFTGDFVDPVAGYFKTVELFEQGADTVFAVAGFTGVGSYYAAAEWKELGHIVRVVEPDFDWYDEGGDPARVLLTSVLKDTGVATFNQIESFVDGAWTPGVIWEDLGSNGTEITKFHKTNDQVPDEVREALNMIRRDIIAGEVQTSPMFP